MRFNILVVEDEKDILEILVSMVEMIFLKHYPFLSLNISTAQNGKTALSIAQEQRQDIILSDIIMPVMDGIEFIKKVRLFDKSVPILVLSALSSNEDVDRIMQAGASNYTSKPLNGKLFIAQIRVFIDFYLRRQRKYNSSAINLFSKNIYRRKTEFLIEKEDDIVEFWEFFTNDTFEQCRVERVLQFIYDIELLIVKKGISNSIVLEESNEIFYLTLSEMDKLDEDIVINMFKKNILDEASYINDGFFISLLIYKKHDIETEEEKIIVVEKNDKKNKNALKEAALNDIRYSIHEKVTPEEFLSELDPTYEDKIEGFREDLNLLSISIFDLETADLSNAKIKISEIANYFSNFNTIVSQFGLFNVINRSFGGLISFLSEIDEEILTNSEKRVLLSKMMQGLADDLESWIIMLFIDRTATDIHYFDASFSDNCFAIQSTFLQTDEEEMGDEDDLEFF